MDCGDFVKIGVSKNVEQRRSQIPYKIKQYYCTEPIKGAFEIERMIHRTFKNKREKNAKGREYFNVDFSEACESVKLLVAIMRGINMDKVFLRNFSKLSKKSKMMVFAYVMALCDKENELF